MHFGKEWKALSIENHVSSISNIETFMIKIGNEIISQVPNYLTMIYEMLGPHQG